MKNGKKICQELKEIRRKIAEHNGIALDIPECTHEGDCRGSCPRCEAEVRYLERELEKRMRLGKAAVVAGVALGLASCSGTPQPTESYDDDGEYMGIVQLDEELEDEGWIDAPSTEEVDSIVKSKFISYDGQVFGGDQNESLVDEY